MRMVTSIHDQGKARWRLAFELYGDFDALPSNLSLASQRA
jgi:hypothetical protein